MRIAIVCPGFSAYQNHWVIPALQLLATHLAQHHQVFVFSQRYPGRGVYQFGGLTHFALGAGERRGVYSPWVWRQSARQLIDEGRQTPFDVIHAFWADEAGFSAVLAGKVLKCPTVISLGGWELTHVPHIGYGAQQYAVKRLILDYVFRQATVVTAGSPYQLDLTQNYQIPPKKSVLAPLGVDTTCFNLHPNIETDTQSPTIIQVGSLIPVKNQQLLLDVLAYIKQDLPQIQLNLIGSGPLQAELAQVAVDLRVASNITWHNQINYKQLPQMYRQAQVYVQTSWHESQGMAVLEGVACGLPVVGTPVGALRDQAHASPTWDASALASQILEILAHKPTPRPLPKMYHLDQAAETFTETYHQAIEKDDF